MVSLQNAYSTVSQGAGFSNLQHGRTLFQSLSSNSAISDKVVDNEHTECTLTEGR